MCSLVLHRLQTARLSRCKGLNIDELPKPQQHFLEYNRTQLHLRRVTEAQRAMLLRTFPGIVGWRQQVQDCTVCDGRELMNVAAAGGVEHCRRVPFLHIMLQHLCKESWDHLS